MAGDSILEGANGISRTQLMRGDIELLDNFDFFLGFLQKSKYKTTNVQWISVPV